MDSLARDRVKLAAGQPRMFCLRVSSSFIGEKRCASVRDECGLLTFRRACGFSAGGRRADDFCERGAGESCTGAEVNGVNYCYYYYYYFFFWVRKVLKEL